MKAALETVDWVPKFTGIFIAVNAGLVIHELDLTVETVASQVQQPSAALEDPPL